jgi:diguanylate cyclase (GGDEF)-like protein
MVAKEAECDIVCSRIREEIIPVLYRVVIDDEVMYHNLHRVSCWQRKGCSRTDCLGHGDTEVPCWYLPGTSCCEAASSFAEKISWCRECEVFRDSCPTLVEELGEALNHLLFSLHEEKKSSRKHLKKIEYLNRELLCAVENLDSRNREIQELVITDRLTGLYNRNYLMTVLEDEILRCQRNDDPLTAMMIDLDNFKVVNDSYGHASGDRLLSHFSALLQRTLRKCDRAFRYGGEEFVAVLSGTDLTMAWILAERIRSTYQNEPIIVQGKDAAEKTIFQTMSIGLAAYRKGMSLGDLLEQADAAVYQAKAEGRNRVSRFGID